MSSGSNPHSRAKKFSHFRTTLLLSKARLQGGGRCGTLPVMDESEDTLQDQIASAWAAVAAAKRVREHHRRRTDKRSKQRAQDIEVALNRIRDAMAPLRSYLGRFPYVPQTEVTRIEYDDVSDASRALQAERRKLWKMSHRPCKIDE